MWKRKLCAFIEGAICRIPWCNWPINISVSQLTLQYINLILFTYVHKTDFSKSTVLNNYLLLFMVITTLFQFKSKFIGDSLIQHM